MSPDKPRPLFPIYDIMEHWQAFAYSEPDVRPIHHALYYALVQMCKRRGGTQRFNLPYTDGMQASSIGSRNTYLATLRDLEKWGFAVYTPGANGLKAPIVHVKFCASAEHLVDIWRASTYASADTSAEHIEREVKRLKENEDRLNAQAVELEKKLAQAEALLAELQAGKPTATAPTPVVAQPAEEKLGGPARLVAAEDSEVFTRVGFREFAKSIGFGSVDIGHYLVQILHEAKKEKPRATSGKGLTWEGFVKHYLNNDRLHNRLVYPVPAYDGQSTQAVGRNAVTPAAAVGDLNARIEAQQKQAFIL